MIQRTYQSATAAPACKFDELTVDKYTQSVRGVATSMHHCITSLRHAQEAFNRQGFILKGNLSKLAPFINAIKLCVIVLMYYRNVIKANNLELSKSCKRYKLERTEKTLSRWALNSEKLQ